MPYSELAYRLNDIFQKVDPWGYVDSEGSVELCEYNIKNKPEDVIAWLIDRLEEVLD